MKIICNFATENRKGGRVSPPCWFLSSCSNPMDCESYEPDFENCFEAYSFHRLFGFHFSYSLKGFRNPFAKLSLFDVLIPPSH